MVPFIANKEKTGKGNGQKEKDEFV